MLAKPFLFWYHRYSVIYNTKILTPCWSQGVSDHKEVRKSMNKYELAVVLSAKLEDDERAAALEKVKGYITRFGGNVVMWTNGARRDLHTRSRRAKRDSTTSYISSLIPYARMRWRTTSASWSRLSDILRKAGRAVSNR